jgi:hypothetical protein
MAIPVGLKPNVKGSVQALRVYELWQAPRFLDRKGRSRVRRMRAGRSVCRLDPLTEAINRRTPRVRWNFTNPDQS